MSYPVQSQPTDQLQARKARQAGWKVDYPKPDTRAAWAAHMARIGALVDRKNRAWRTFMRRTHKLAALADPRTGGNEMLVHNWGNDQARAVWAHGWERWRRYGAAFDRRYRAMLDAAREI